MPGEAKLYRRISLCSCESRKFPPQGPQTGGQISGNPARRIQRITGHLFVRFLANQFTHRQSRPNGINIWIQTNYGSWIKRIQPADSSEFVTLGYRPCCSDTDNHARQKCVDDGWAQKLRTSGSIASHMQIVGPRQLTFVEKFAIRLVWISLTFRASAPAKKEKNLQHSLHFH